MWSFLTSFFGNKINSHDLSLENACSLLVHSPETSRENVTENSKESVEKNTFLTQTGRVTNIVDNKIFIDDFFTCDTSLIQFEVELGDEVIFEVLVSEGKKKIVKVSAIDSEWDISENKNQLWNNRIIICKVDKRIDRKLYLFPGDIEVDLNNASVEFLPIVGDWLELDVKCTINENSVNLLGNLIEINSISPVRSHVVSGTISSWNSEQNTGLINKNIFYNLHSLSCGYNPVLGDRVVVQVIESEQNRCCWRALQVIPESLKTVPGNSFHDSISSTNFVSEHPGIDVSGLNLHFENLNITKYFFITIYNNSENDVTFRKAEILNNISQCKIIESHSHVIRQGSNYRINCQSVSRNMGTSKDFLLLTFEEFNIGKWITVNVDLKSNNTHSPNKHYNYNTRHKSRNDYSQNQVIKGQSVKSSRFQAVRIPLYELPQKLLTFICQYDSQKDTAIILEELKNMKPVLFQNLSYTNYEDKFHTLLHLDEIANLIAVKNYDQDKACFIANNEFLMLEIENLSERRPSIVIGDKILATDPMNEKRIDFEGVVHKVGAKHVFLKFSPLFHDQYNGEDYSIRVVPGRQMYRKLHHAVYLVVRALGGELLFPSKLLTKNPQIEFKLECANTMEEKTQLLISNKNEMVLEWYNKKLNLPQQNAVINVLNGMARPLPYIIFGPPGTGKTVTLIEIVLQLTRCMPQSR